MNQAVPKRKRIRLGPDSYRRSGTIFSVTIGTNPRQDVFLDLEFGKECIDILKMLSERTKNPVFAYCMMPDHAHLLVGVEKSSPLSSFVGAWKSLCYQARRRRGLLSKFWQYSYYDRALRSDDDVRAAASYILNNPVRRKLVETFSDYPLCGSFELEL